MKGLLIFGVRVNEALYVSAPFRKILKLYGFTECVTAYPGTSMNTLTLFKEARHLGVFKSFNLILNAVDPTKVYPYFGKTHKTYIICNGTVTKDEIFAFLSLNNIAVGEDNIFYKADLKSFSWRNS